jgi:LmbE family N-acetylglucosaminyl deacetylase
MLDLSPLGVESLWFKEGGESSRRLLGIFAHPDDESFGPGATLARYAAEGVEVHVLTVTDGAAGDLLSSFPPGVSSLADLRHRELQCSVRTLGATAMHTLDYRDSGMSGTPANQDPDCLLQADRDMVVRQLTGAIRAIRPQVVITHDSTGVYFHPDHIRTWELATAAFQGAGEAAMFPGLAWQPYSPQSLYYTVVPKSRVTTTVLLARLSLKDPHRWGRNGDVDLTRLGIPDEDIQVEIDVRSYLEQKALATRCHRSQGGDNRRPSLFSRIVQRRIGGASKWDYFVQAYPTPLPRRGQRKRDLFT